MERVIKIYKGEETGIIRENYDSRKDSIFAEQYSMALEAINTYLDASQIESDIIELKDEDNLPVYDRSNIFAFIGDRGTGKTSCMQSVAGMLEDYYKEKHKKDLKSLVLPIIDPTLFDDNTNILHLVIGTLFQEFKRNLRKSESFSYENEEKDYEKKKQDLIEAFQNVKDCIKIISDTNSLKCEGDDISQLADMASVSDLRKQMKRLVDKYLIFFDKKVLVLQVDDIDLQTKHAYRMVEELRKYFVLKNVVILMSFKLEQLTKVIELENAKLFKPLKDFYLISSVDIELMAAKYILKLMPVNQRIFMPTFEVYADSQIEYYSDHTSDKKSLIGDGSPISVKYAITTLIYQKCRFLFYHSKGVVSPIVPRTLRELRHLLALLESMPDNSANIIQNNHNKNAFLKYFYSTWVNNNISADDINIVRNISQTKDVATINKIVLQQLQTKYGALLEERDDDNKIFKAILNEKNASYNISIADVYVVIDYIRNIKSGLDDRMLMFYISTFYSLKLYEYYDELTDSITNANKSKSEELKKKHPDSEIRKEEKTDKINNYQLLIGGLFINTDEYKLIPKAKEQTQNKLRINYRLLKESAQSIIDGTENDEYRINLIELLTLCTYRLFETKEPGKTKFRTSSDVYYDFNSEREYNSVEFDLGAFFFNIIDVERAYNRVHPELYLHVKDKEISLYNKILKGCLEQRNMGKDASDSEQKHAMLSCTAIRNFEVLSNFIMEIEYNWTDRSKKSMIEKLCDFFKKVAGYNIKLYVRKKEKGQHGRENMQPIAISFEYADVITKVLGLEGISKEKSNEKLKEYTDFVDALFYVKEFDLDNIMKSFNGRLYSTERIRDRIVNVCESYIKEDERLIGEIDVWISNLIRSNKVRVSPADVRWLMQRLKIVYETVDEE